MEKLEPAKHFILTKLNECFLFTYSDNLKRIYHIYDKQALRTKKLLRLSNSTEDINFQPNSKSIILLEQDYEKEFLWYDRFNIHKILNVKYYHNKQQIEDVLIDILKIYNYRLIPVAYIGKEALSLTVFKSNWKILK